MSGNEAAVVVGASMAGLCAARVLADHVEEVLVVDRDALDGDEPRAQVPQGRHPHLLLPAGCRLLEGWFPGLVDELVAGGAVDLDLCRDFYWHQAGGPARRPASGLRSPAMSRPFLEATVRRRLERLPGVQLRPETAVDGLVARDGRITGVRLADGSIVPARLVVDATGRAARSIGWIEALGFEGPATDVVHVDTRYATRAYRRDRGGPWGWRAAAVVGDPSTKRLAMALPAEADRWLVVLGGLNGEVPPTDEDGRLAWARSLPSPAVADVMAASEPLGDAVTHRFPANQRRRFDKLRRLPAGWVAIGDAISSFDPIYGQGMTSAAMQAAALGRCLERAGAVDHRFARRYFRAAARAVATPWSIAVGGDFAYPGTTGDKPPGTDLVNRYMERVNVAAQHDDGVAIRFNEVASLVRRPESLLTPAFALRVLLAARRRAGVPGTVDAAAAHVPG